MIYDHLAYLKYIQRPYLNNAAEAMLTHRYEAICANLWTAPPPGIPHLQRDPSKLTTWSARLTEIRTERFRRIRSTGIYRGSPSSLIPFDETHLLSTTRLDNRIASAVRTLRLPSSPFLVRFTDACFVRDAMRHGRFRIGPASNYNDPSLNAAQRDDELSHAAVRSDRHLAARMIGYLPGEDPSQAREMPVQWLELFEYMNSANFYVLCLTNQFDARMFSDFGKDAAIIIHDPADFLKRLKNEALRRLPNLQFIAKPVNYYDPYNVKVTELQPGFSKNFSFAYQSEFRPTWWAPDLTKDLPAIFLEIGDLSDIAEAVYLS